jgi:SAM-dependent methyltransferase
VNIRGLGKHWDAWGRRDPMWAILTRPDKKDGGWTTPEFLATGVSEIEAVLAYLDVVVPGLPRRRAMDFGCGLGRLTQALATRFEAAVGVDIAPSMIEQARALTTDARCTFVLNTTADLRAFADDTFDLVYSNITLQHMEPRYALAYIREFVRVAAPQGAIVFQLPAGPAPRRDDNTALGRAKSLLRAAVPPRITSAYDNWKRSLGGEPLMEGHGIPRDEVVALLEGCGAAVRDVRDDDSAAPGWPSYRYCAVKPGRPAA